MSHGLLQSCLSSMKGKKGDSMSKFTEAEKQLKQKIISLQKQNARLSKQVNDLIRQKSGFLENETRYKEAQAIGYIGNWEYDIKANKALGLRGSS